ncbi:hypothetical protein [uncultured Dokdonia sp.]|uniref:hypothetical protein n=1 Tax=uncultured Dokdonia sp. TaxID=575653 RepID=UPI002622C39C|nr:hypothetical protein [uncultured Dokdonia sp.]
MTLEIIVFILSILLGIVLYWRESKSNAVYRFINKLTHNDELQMKPDNRKGFLHLQPFLMRLVYVSLLFIVGAIILQFVTPIQAFVRDFVSAIVGTLVGTYIASAFLFARDSTKKENLEKVFDKGKEMVQDFTEDVKESFESKEQPISKTKETSTQEVPKKKSARDRFKDKGMIK